VLKVQAKLSPVTTLLTLVGDTLVFTVAAVASSAGNSLIGANE